MANNQKKVKSLSRGQKKLAALNITFPFLPTTTIGSFPKTPELTELRYKVSQGVQPISELSRKERIATDLWLREQTRLGLDLFVDGEMNRGDPVWFFAQQIDGFEPGGLVRLFENRFVKKPIIKSKVAWKNPMTVEYWQLTQRATHSPVKAVVTGPFTLLDWSFNEYYSTRESALNDLAAVVRKEIQTLAEAGARIIQIDEPALSTRPTELGLAQGIYNELTKGLKCYFILHHCYSNLTDIWPQLEKMPVDNFALEAANSQFNILKTLKKIPTEKDITLGVVDSQSAAVESPRQLREAIHAALKAVPRNQLWIAPDCGLKSLSTEVVIEKLDAMVQTTRKIRSGK